ncbi:diphthine synthase [Candidatus Woesearchaeota archaeon]|nr:diphthine synthase [Candidatus Woesearchaeota archaeon]
MTLYLIGLGLGTEKDITLRGLEAVKQSDLVYFEDYTSLLQCSFEDLEKFYEKKIIRADRNQSEQGITKILEQAKTKNVSFLVVGDPLSATTHVEIIKQAHDLNIKLEIIPNASVLTAVGLTGLQLYKFGKTTSIPFPEGHPHLETPYNVIKENQALGLHTLCLLDLKPEQNKFMTVPEAMIILENIEQRKQEKIIHDDLLVVGCARLGSKDQIIKSGTAKELKSVDFGKPPHCLIIPGKLHFTEEEMLRLWKIKN